MIYLMRLNELYNRLDSKGRQQLAKDSDVDLGYLYQIATQWRGKKPSVDVINRLLKADRRLKAKDLLDEYDTAPETETE